MKYVIKRSHVKKDNFRLTRIWKTWNTYVIRRRKTTLAFLYAFMDIFCYFKDIIFFELFTLWFHQFSRIFKPIRSSSLSDSDNNKVKHALVFSELVKPCHEQLTGRNNKKLNTDVTNLFKTSLLIMSCQIFQNRWISLVIPG